MKKFIFVILAGLVITGCSGSDQNIYHSEAYTLYSNRVVQGDYEARAVNREHIISNYQSPASTHYSSTIAFKFAINGKDNEAPSGQDHQLTIVPEERAYTSPVIRFGAKDPAGYVDDKADPYLPPNTKFTVRVDMSPVLDEFEEKGFYTTFEGNKIYKSDFNGVYIAGGSEPLSWDFDNLHNNPDYKLSDEDGDGIYTGTFVLNPHNQDSDAAQKEWKLSNDISKYPGYHSDQILVDALYNMALDETAMLIEEDSTFRTGAKWAGVWTRDISYSVLLSLGMIEPEIARKSLMRKVKRDRIIQDTGSGGAWPVSSDRVVWTLAAWELYKITANHDWLQRVYEIVKNSLNDDLQTVYARQYGLFKGESSFLDWREQSYPKWMDNVDISQSMNLGTNAVFYRTFKIMGRMAEQLDNPEAADFYNRQATRIKRGINEHLWNENRGYYDQYLYGRYYMNASPRSEALGESLSILFGVAEAGKADRIISEMPVTPFGTPTFYPQIPNIPPYHNNSVWPFVQAYWNWAAASRKNEQALNFGLASIYRPAALFLTNKENFVAENGDFKGTQINSDRQLWSVAGNLAMVYRVLLGIRFEPDRMVLNPTVPRSFGGPKKVGGFRYRNAVLDIELNGFGSGIQSMTIDGETVDDYVIPAGLKGEHKIKIEMNRRFPDKGGFNMVANKFSLPAPRVERHADTLRWPAVDGADGYGIYRNGTMLEQIAQNHYVIPEGQYGQFKVTAQKDRNKSSFTSEPVSYYPSRRKKVLEMEAYAQSSAMDLVDYTGRGYVEISKDENRQIAIPVDLSESGEYLVSFRYSNGSGPWNTDNKCAIRTLFVDGEKAGTMVLAQRGKDEWSNWGISNRIALKLDKGRHQLKVSFEPSDQNMNGEVNKAVLDHLTLVKVQNQ